MSSLRKQKTVLLLHMISFWTWRVLEGLKAEERNGEHTVSGLLVWYTYLQLRRRTEGTSPTMSSSRGVGLYLTLLLALLCDASEGNVKCNCLGLRHAVFMPLAQNIAQTWSRPNVTFAYNLCSGFMKRNINSWGVYDSNALLFIYVMFRKAVFVCE